MENKNIWQVAIIGAGNLGSRHLQAMKLTEMPLSIIVIDPSEDSLALAKSRFEELPYNSNVHGVNFSSSMSVVPNNLDVAIIATSSGPRRAVIEELLTRTQVTYLILEKVLFQQLDDYDAMETYLKHNGVKAWVNCGRRRTRFYKCLRNMLGDEQHVSMLVSGGNWGLGCNSIHMLDTYSFISKQHDFHADLSRLDSGWINSKREGYIEFTGTLQMRSDKGMLTLTSYKDGDTPLAIQIETEHYRCEIEEFMQRARILTKIDENWEWKECALDGRPQSKVSHELIHELINHGDCGLPSYEESARLHKILLKSFISHISDRTAERCTICPIT